MSRLIDAEAITDHEIIDYLGIRYASCLDDVRDMLNDQPTIEARQVVHGEWIKEENTWVCSVCRKENGCAYSEELERFWISSVPNVEQICEKAVNDMWESPIRLIEQEMQMQLEGDVMKAVHNVGVSVDKEELLRALQYDREQYYRGYNDAVEEFAEEMKRYIATEYGLTDISLKEIESIAQRMKGGE